ncbi:MAG: transketolase C-terminal domain-containing protein [Roseiarcus sp.]|uniref:transketolase C-terminal domain-containing protein n=1 Tax=Roseiarcus sp. TaxID=1969460 RepID=UPI003C6756B5
MRTSARVAIIACGVMVARALEAAERLAQAGINARVVNMVSIAPLDEEAVRSAADLGAIVTVEEHSMRGGLGGAVCRLSAMPDPDSRVPRLHADRLCKVPVRKVWPDAGRNRNSSARRDFATVLLDKWSTMARAPILVAHDPRLHLSRGVRGNRRHATVGLP